MSNAGDRRRRLAEHPTLNGIDFVEVSTDQTTLEVHFQKPPSNDLKQRVTGATITGGEVIPSVEVLPFGAADWVSKPTGTVLVLHVPAPGDFSTYTLELEHTPGQSPVLDPYFDHITFTFKTQSNVDCEAPEPARPERPSEAPPIDYLAKDFWSFRKALLDFSALRYPAWQERSESDFGVMFLEALASIADDLSYTQDRIAAEASLETATERRSVVRHARLVDYEPRPATAARVLLQLDVRKAGAIASGLPVSALGPAGASIEFETGTGLLDLNAYPVSPEWNRGKVVPHLWDEGERCLRAGATELWVAGSGLGFKAGQRLLIDTEPEIPGGPSLRELVRLVADGQEDIDPLGSYPVTRLVWRTEDALQGDRDLTRTFVVGNLVPATQGRRTVEVFTLPEGPKGRASTIVRRGPDGTTQYLYSLGHAPLAWLAPVEDSAAAPRPEIRLAELSSTAGRPWSWRRTLLEADGFDEAFTIDPMRYRPVGERRKDGTISMEYDGRDGDTLRFGDGVFGAIPVPGSVFQVIYRVGGGAAGNVAEGSITQFDPHGPLGEYTDRITNPLPAGGGADEESDESVRRLAPHAFRARLLRVVREEDYESAAETLPWVQRAGTVFRHTGSWLTAFTSADPVGASELSPTQHSQLIALLNRYRLAGYESYVPAPRYVSLDLEVRVFARADAFRGDVAEAVRQALSAERFPDGSTGFFHVDRFTFGSPLVRSVLEAAIQRINGVEGVLAINYRRRGYTQGFVNLLETIQLGSDEILLVDSNPSRPERGSVSVQVEGGK